jgi:hypothetical protein
MFLGGGGLNDACYYLVSAAIPYGVVLLYTAGGRFRILVSFSLTDGKRVSNNCTSSSSVQVFSISFNCWISLGVNVGGLSTIINKFFNWLLAVG